ncbi:hypothetical protein [Arthrobacter sp. HLT1-21]
MTHGHRRLDGLPGACLVIGFLDKKPEGNPRGPSHDIKLLRLHQMGGAYGRLGRVHDGLRRVSWEQAEDVELGAE